LAAIGALDQDTRRVFTIVAWASPITLIVPVVYGLIEAIRTPSLPVGAHWVNGYWPFPPYFAQPVTYFSVACIALFYSGLSLWELRIAKWPKGPISFLQLSGFIVAFSSAYEVLYNFNSWSAI
jgi:hypothetical protein